MPRRRTKAEYTPFGQMIDDLQGNLTDEDLGNKAELSRNQVYLIKTGKSGTSQRSVKNLAIALGLTKREDVVKFYELSGYSPPDDVLPPIQKLRYEPTEEEKEQFLSWFNGRAPEERSRAMKMLKAAFDDDDDFDEGAPPYGRNKH